MGWTVTYNHEELGIYQEALELRRQARKLQSQADKARYNREKQAEEDRINDRLKRNRAAFALNVNNLLADITKTIPVAYGDHSFTTQLAWDSGGDVVRLTVWLTRK